jgi:hypothetical protein
MVNIEIPYSSENNRIDRDYAKKEIHILSISDEEKAEVLKAIYNINPRIVSFNGKDTDSINRLQQTLGRLGVPYRKIED